ncbi:LysR family transcriptional regulator [bacterium]|nr:LysR family transcriptional regulator [bacterium]MCI0604017.1 LysR family transcriptional regulator [bacterium]
MDLHQLSLFLAVAESGSISAAARLRNISQPVLSLHVQNLEEYFGVPLLDRIGRGVELTEAGNLLVQKIRAVLGSVMEMKEAIEEWKDLGRGFLKIGGSTTPGAYLLPKILGQFKKEFPGIELDLLIGNTAQVEQWVSENALSLGVIGKKTTLPALEAVPFVKDELVVITPANHVFSKKKSIRAKDLAGYPFIIREEGSNTRQTYEDVLKRKGIKLNIALELGSTEAIKQAVSAGLGISIVSPLCIQSERKHKDLHVLRVHDAEFVREFHIISLRDKHLSPGTQRFLHQLKTYADLPRR